MSDLSQKQRCYVLLGVGAVASGVAAAASGVAVVLCWRRAQGQRATAVKDLHELRREVERLHRLVETQSAERANVITCLQETERQVRQLHKLAANESALYLRGFMDGRGFTDCP